MIEVTEPTQKDEFTQSAESHVRGRQATFALPAIVNRHSFELVYCFTMVARRGVRRLDNSCLEDIRRDEF
jgi:hypothetical protein